MHAQPAFARLFALLVVLVLPIFAWAEEEEDSGRVGIVNKVENQAQVVSASGATAAIVGTPVHMRDELRTGADARLQIIFRDDTVLTLGEQASVVIDRYVFDPDQGIGETVCRQPRAPSVSPPAGSRSSATGRSRSPRPSPISGSAAPSSGVDRSRPNMGCFCSTGKSLSPTRRDA
jgi:hypothetical protein